MRTFVSKYGPSKAEMERLEHTKYANVPQELIDELTVDIPIAYAKILGASEQLLGFIDTEPCAKSLVDTLRVKYGATGEKVAEINRRLQI